MMADVWLTPTLGASSVVTWPIPDNWVAWEVAHPSSVALEWPTRMARWKPQGPEGGTASSPIRAKSLSLLRDSHRAAAIQQMRCHIVYLDPSSRTFVFPKYLRTPTVK